MSIFDERLLDLQVDGVDDFVDEILQEKAILFMESRPDTRVSREKVILRCALFLLIDEPREDKTFFRLATFLVMNRKSFVKRVVTALKTSDNGVNGQLLHDLMKLSDEEFYRERAFCLECIEEYFSRREQAQLEQIKQENALNFDQEFIGRSIAKYTPKKIYEILDKYILGQTEAKIACAKFTYYHIIRHMNPEIPARNIFVVGPSGCGKTEMWRVIRKELGIPVKIIDSSVITKEGWKGKSKFSTVLKEVECNKKMAPIIVFDEFDEISSMTFNSEGENTNFSLQGELLKTLEGENENVSQFVSIVFLGAYEELYKKKQGERTIGFLTQESKRQKDIDKTKITIKDLIDFGLRTELAGRISEVVEIQSLDMDDYIEVARTRCDSLRKLYEMISGTEYDIPEDVIRKAAAFSIENQLGVRGMIKQLENRFIDEMYENDGVDNSCY